MRTDHTGTRRTMLTGGALSAALSVTNQPLAAKAKRGTKGKQRPKPPIVSAVVRLTAVSTTLGGNGPRLDLYWEAKGWDLRAEPPVTFSLPFAVFVPATKPEQAAKEVRKSLAIILGVPESQRDRIKVFVA